MDRSRRRLAVALGYQPLEDATPTVLASGAGLWAERIEAMAREHGVPIKEDEGLAPLLATLPLESEIPPELFPAVAQVFAFLYQLGSSSSGDGSSS